MPPCDASKEACNVMFGGTKYPLLLGAVCGALNVTWWSKDGEA